MSFSSKDMGLGILIDVGGTQFELSIFRGKDPAARANQATSLLVAINDQDGAEIDLVDNLLTLIDGTIPGEQSTSRELIPRSLSTIILYAGSISFRQDKDSSNKTTKLIGVSGKAAWRPSIDLGDPDFKLTVDIDAEFQLFKGTGANSKVEGFIEGMISVPIPGIEFLSVGARYDMGQTASGVSLLLEIGPLNLIASYSKNKDVVTYSFAMREVPTFTLGDIISFFASLVDPSVDKFEFDKPFDIITDINIGAFLNNASFFIEFHGSSKEKVVGFRYKIDNSFSILKQPPFLDIDAIVLRYEGNSKTRKKSLKMRLEGMIFGESGGAEWDPVNGAPPVPKQEMALFDLRYLAIGQHVAIKNAQHAKNIGEIMRMLSGSLDANEQKLLANRALLSGNPANSFLGHDSPVEFNADSGLLIGLDVTMLKFLNLSIIFNDPIVYGLRIELAGKTAKNFAGLIFEILYQKINETTGKYHIELTLPDYVRHLQMGAVSVTLPVIVVDIFTNGDFKLDLGFPWNFNFSRSFAIEVFPFTGAGGFYFNKLSGATAISTPRLKDSNPLVGGEFTPVYEFGLGLKVGLGKTFSSGPFRAEISITIQGLIEGVFSYFNYPANNPPSLIPANSNFPDRETYFMIKGGVALVGRLYGAVDFVVVKVEVEVLIEAMIKFYIESYKPIEVYLSARVSVKAKAKVLFVKVKFKFSLTVEQEFTIASPLGSTAPWDEYLLNS